MSTSKFRDVDLPAVPHINTYLCSTEFPRFPRYTPYEIKSPLKPLANVH